MHCGPPRALSLRLTCSLQRVWEPHVRARPQLAPDFLSGSMISKGQVQTSKEKSTGNQSWAPSPLLLQPPWGRHWPGTKDVGGGCLGQKARRKCTVIHLWAAPSPRASQACKRVILSVSIRACTWTEATRPAPLPVWIWLSSGSLGHRSAVLWPFRIESPHPCCEGSFWKAREAGSGAKMKSLRLQGAQWPSLLALWVCKLK